MTMDSKTAAYWDGYAFKEADLFERLSELGQEHTQSPGYTSGNLPIRQGEGYDPQGMVESGAPPSKYMDWAASQLNEDFMLRLSSGGTARKFATALGTGGIGALIGGLFGGGRGALAGTLIGAVVGFLMEALNIGAPQAWKAYADARAKGVGGKLISDAVKQSKQTGKGADKITQEILDAQSDSVVDYRATVDAINQAKGNGTWEDSKVRAALTQKLGEFKTKVSDQVAKRVAEQGVQVLESVEGPKGAPAPVVDMQRKTMEKTTRDIEVASSALNKDERTNKLRTDRGLAPLITPGVIKKRKKDLAEAYRRRDEARYSVETGLGQGAIWGGAAPTGKLRELKVEDYDTPQEYADAWEGLQEAKARATEARFGVDIRKGPVSRWEALKAGVKTPSGVIARLGDPNIGWGSTFAGVPRWMDTREKAEQHFAQTKGQTGGLIRKQWYQAAPTTAGMAAQRARVAADPVSSARQQAVKKKQADREAGAATTAANEARKVKTSPAGAPGFDRPMYMTQKQTSLEQGAHNMDIHPLNMSWQAVLQKNAVIGPAGAPPAEQTMPAQGAAPAPQTMPAPPAEPSPSDIFTHQSKMKEMEGQKALIDAKAQAEQVKAQTSQSLAATKAQEAATAQPTAGQPAPAPAPDQSQTAQPGQMADQGQGSGMQPAAQMPQAQWGQPAVA